MNTVWEILEGFFDAFGNAFIRNYLNVMSMGVADEKMSDKKIKRFKALVYGVSVTLFFAFIFGLFFLIEGVGLLRSLGIFLMVFSVLAVALYISIGYILRICRRSKNKEK